MGRWLRGGCMSAMVILLAFAPPAPAQEDSTLHLDWDTAWKLALEHNESLALARDEVAKAKHKVGEAWSSAMPSVEFNGVMNHYFKVPQVIFTIPANTPFNPAPDPIRMKTEFQSPNNVSANVQLTQPLWLAGKIGLGLEAAKTYKQLSETGVRLSRDDLRLNLTRSFYGVILADEAVRVTREALEQAVRHRENVEALYDQGVVSEYDMIRARVAVANFKPRLREAEASRDLAYRALKILIGVDVDRDVEVRGDLDSATEAPPEDYTSASQLALQNRLEFRQLDLQRKLYEIQYKVERRNWLWPNLLAGLRWETLAQSEELDIPRYEFLNGIGGQLILQIPLFDGFASRHRAEQAKINMRSVQRQRVMLERGVKLEIYRALSDWRTSSEDLKAALETQDQARRGMEIAEVRYSEGVGTQLEVLDAQLQLNNANVNVLRAKYNQLMAKAAYDRALGLPFDETVASGNER